MWRNADVLDFVGWLRAHNERRRRSARKTGFYGLDLYSLGASMEAVIAYLDEQDPQAAQRARARYECLQPYAGDSAAYGQAVLLGVGEPCRRRVIEQLVELRRRAGEYLLRDGLGAEDEYFFAEQNAAIVANAEEYYRTMFGDRAGSWNLRDRHMADTLDHLLAHLDRHGGTARVVVWAHNSHVGDARATEMAQRGELNIGQLMRERHGHDVVNVGFTTYTGSVTAASEWGGPAERKRVRPALPDSYEALLHASTSPLSCCARSPSARAAARCGQPRLERAIGVIYQPADRTPEPLVRRERRPAIRRVGPHRRHARGRAAGAHPRLGARRAPGDVPERPLRLLHAGEAEVCSVVSTDVRDQTVREPGSVGT